MASPNLVDALRLSESNNMAKKTKVLRGDTARKVLARVSKKDTEAPKKKGRSASEVRKAMYGKE